MTDGRTWPALLTRLLAGENLDGSDTGWVMDKIMTGEATPAQLAGFAVALRAKGETAAEVSGLVDSMLAHAVRVSVPGRAVDIVGTGGDQADTVNISTMAAVMVAGTGARVVKHGNRAASSLCGAADVLEELGVALTLTPAQVAAVAVEVGITFCFAPVFHPSMRFVGPTRRELGVTTVFNFLGPLTNPARPGAQAVGCADPAMAVVLAEVFARRGVSAVVVRGDDGLDEVTTATTTQVWRVDGGAVQQETFDPGSVGIARSEVDALRGGDRAFNAAAVRDLLAGQSGAIRDAVLLNAATALVALGPGHGSFESDMEVGVAQASEAIDSGAAAAVLERWVAATQAYA